MIIRRVALLWYTCLMDLENMDDPPLAPQFGQISLKKSLLWPTAIMHPCHSLPIKDHLCSWFFKALNISLFERDEDYRWVILSFCLYRASKLYKLSKSTISLTSFCVCLIGYSHLILIFSKICVIFLLFQLLIQVIFMGCRHFENVELLWQYHVVFMHFVKFMKHYLVMVQLTY